MFNVKTVVNVVMEDLTEDKILIMFPESRHYEKMDMVEESSILVELDSCDESCEEEAEDLIEAMLKDVDPELLKPRVPQAPVELNVQESKNLAHALDVQLESLSETLQRLRYYLHEIEQFLPEKNRRRQ